ncbi:MAG: hypothetical protein M3308_09895 [Actinomycetota bacterium]|nr:hypothetical protein [Actinomycetota bacterium]
MAGSQVALALANYGVLALAGRALPAAGFAALSAFYLLVNTVGRGVFAVIELELTRSTADARARAIGEGPARATAIRHAAVLGGVALAALIVCTPVLQRALGGDWFAVALLAVGMGTTAVSYLVRGPLAGARRYHRYTATFVAEAVVGATIAVVFVSAGVVDVRAWVAIFALAPLAALSVFLVPAGTERSEGTPREREDDTGSASTLGQFAWSATLLFTGQALWNLAPVIVAYRLAEDPQLAAGFTAFAIVLRVPVLLFPALQAMLLPPITAMVSRGEHRTMMRLVQRLLAAIAALGACWLAGSILLAEPLVDLLFAAVGIAPSTPVIVLLALSALIGAAAQVLQIGLVAQRRQRIVALGWLAGVLVLVTTAFLPAAPVVSGGASQLAGAAVAATAMSSSLWHRSQRGTRLAATVD